MSKKHLLLIPVTLLALLIFTACSDDDPTTPQQDPEILLTLNLTDDFLNSYSTDGMVFASTTDGLLLDVATWTEAGPVVLRNATFHPATISYTLVVYNEWSLMLTTELDVPKGSERTPAGITQRGDRPSGQTELTFLNAPDSQWHRISSNGSTFSGAGSLPPDRTVSMFGDSTDCFVRIDPANEIPQGGWLRGLQSGDRDTLDFSKPNPIVPLVGKTVGIPQGGDRMWFIFGGEVEVGSLTRSINFDFQTYTGTVPESVILYAPEFDPAKLRSNFYMHIPGSPATTYTQVSPGPVPDAFTGLEGDLTIASTPSDSLAFAFTGNWETLMATWVQRHEITASWFVEGAAPRQTFALPQLPHLYMNLFPDYPREGFELYNLELFEGKTGDTIRSQGKVFSVEGGLDLHPTTPYNHSTPAFYSKP